MDLRQLESFVAVMSAGSITTAARMLNRSQPAVSRAIQELEAEIGFELLTATTRASRRPTGVFAFTKRSSGCCPDCGI